METIEVAQDISVFYVAADSYPQGIESAHDKLHLLVPVTADRQFYGISRPENGVIVYRAAAEEKYKGEAETFNCKTLKLHKGTYICLEVKDYLKHIGEIAKAFDQLLKDPRIDPQGYCVEWYYQRGDVKCMVRLK